MRRRNIREQNIVQWRGRSHGVGNPRVGYVAGRKTDARTQTEAAPDGHTDMRCRPAHQSLPTDVSGSASPSARSIRTTADRTPRPANDKLRVQCLTGDIRTYVRRAASVHIKWKAL